MNESRATRYQRLRRRARVLSAIPAASILAVVALTPTARWLSDVSHAAAAYVPLPAGVSALLVFVILLVMLWEAARLPSRVAFAFNVDRVYGRGRASFDDTLLSHLQGAVVGLAVSLTAAALVHASVSLAGAWWWVPAGLALSGLLAASLRAAPALLARMAHVRPLARPDLAADLLRLAARVNVPVSGIDEWVVGEGARATALVTGVGRGRRVLVASELARHWTDEEIAVVVAHELAHHAHGDLWRSLAVNAVIVSAALGLAQGVLALLGPALEIAGAADLPALPLIALVVGLVWVLSAPLRHAQSRTQERRADVFALKVTGGSEAFVAAIRRLGARHLAEEHPSLLTQWLYASHPPVAERLALAEAHRQHAGRAVARDA